jgi:hypothetical protein
MLWVVAAAALLSHTCYSAYVSQRVGTGVHASAAGGCSVPNASCCCCCYCCYCRIRDLNDEINKLIREKGHWERRIVELGGPDYAKTAPKITGGCV